MKMPITSPCRSKFSDVFFMIMSFFDLTFANYSYAILHFYTQLITLPCRLKVFVGFLYDYVIFCLFLIIDIYAYFIFIQN
jgi:hypothetical protein